MREIPYIILSYPRSGNHWNRYIIEHFSDRPTIGADCSEGGDYKNVVDSPICMRSNLPNVNVDAHPIAKKRHKLLPEDTWDRRLYVIIRDPFEAIIRHIDGTSGLNIGYPKVKTNIDNYFYVLNVFDKWTYPKLICNYEDLLIDSPKCRDTIREVTKFFEINEETRLTRFMENIDIHKRGGIGSLVNRSHTNGSSRKFHSSKLSKKDKDEWVVYMKRKYGHLVDKYLQRYDI